LAILPHIHACTHTHTHMHAHTHTHTHPHAHTHMLVLGNIPKIPYTGVFSSNHFKGIDFQIYRLCCISKLYYEGSGLRV